MNKKSRIKRYHTTYLIINQLIEDTIIQYSTSITSNSNQSPSLTNFLTTEIHQKGKDKIIEVIKYILLKRSNRTNEAQIVLTEYLKTLENFMSLLNFDNNQALIQEALTRISKSLTIQEESSTSMLFRAGEKGSKFYIILQGKVTVLIPKEIKVKMGSDDYLSHISFLSQLNELDLLKKMLEENKAIYDVNMTDSHKPMIANLLNKTLKEKSHKINDITYTTVDQYIKDITPQDSINGYSPEVSVWIYYKVTDLEDGSTFGENALLSKKSLRTAAIFINESTLFGVLDEMDFNSSIRTIQIQHKTRKINFILSFNIFGEISFELFTKKYWNHFICIKKKLGEVLFSQGEKRDLIFFLKEGEIDLSCKLSLKDIYNLLINFKDTCTTNNPIVDNKENSIARKLKISTVKDNTLIGGDDSIFENETYFCSGICVSKTAEIYAIEVKVLNHIINFCNTNKEYNAIIAERIKMMIIRLKTFQKVDAIIYKRHSYTIDIKDSNNKKILNHPRMTIDASASDNARKALKSITSTGLPIMSTTNKTISKLQTSSMLPSLTLKLNNKEEEGDDVPIKSKFGSIVLDKKYQNNSDFQKKKSSNRKMTYNGMAMTLGNENNCYNENKEKMRKLCNDVEKKKIATKAKENEKVKENNKNEKIIYSKLRLNADYTLTSTYDMNTMIDYYLMGK